MTVTGKPITALPAAESVTNEDVLVVYKDGVAKRAAASMFRGDPAKINGVNALTLDAGENVTMSQDGDTLRVSVADTTYDAATPSAAGLMSAADKSKLDGIPADATNNAGTVTEIMMNGVSKGAGGVVDLGTVPNAATNDLTPTYTMASTLAALSSGEKLSVAFGKIAKGVSDLIAHLADGVRHITAAERTAWNNKVDKVTGKGLSDNNYTTAEKLKLENIESGAQVNEVSAEQYGLLYRSVSVLFRRSGAVLNWDDFLEVCGYKATRTAYASTAAAIEGFNNGDIVVIKFDGGFNEYGKASQVPLAGYSGTYYRETYSLIS